MVKSVPKGTRKTQMNQPQHNRGELASVWQSCYDIDVYFNSSVFFLTSGEIGKHSRSRGEDDMDNQPHDSEQLTCAEHVRL